MAIASTGIKPSGKRSRVHYVLWALTIITIGVLLLAAIRRVYMRRSAAIELTDLVERDNNGFVLLRTQWPWSTLNSIVGMDKEWYFSDCHMQLVDAGNDGAFLSRMSDSAAGIVTTLHVTGVSYNEDNMLQIVRMNNLKELAIFATSVSDQWFLSLNYKSLPLLTVLLLDGDESGITDSGVLRSTIVPHLKVLGMSHCKRITDLSIPKLSEGERLVSLSLNGTSITESGYMRLKRALPRCEELVR